MQRLWQSRDAAPAATDEPSQEEVRAWASANGLVTPSALLQFLHQMDAGERTQGPHERALVQAMTDNYYGMPQDLAMRPRHLLLAHGEFLTQLGSLVPTQYAGVPVPRLTPDGPAPQGDWVDPLLDPLYRYPDGTPTPFWPPSLITTTDYVDQTLRELLHYPPGNDNTRAFVGHARPDDPFLLVLGVEDMFAAMQFAHEMGSLMYGARVSPDPVLSGPRAFGAVLREWPGLQPNLYSLHAPFLVVAITDPDRQRAVIAQNARIIASVESPADSGAEHDDDEPARAFEAPSPTPLLGVVNRRRGSPPSIPKSAWRALLNDMLDAVRAGRAEDVGLYPTPPGSIVITDDAAALIRPGDPRFVSLGAPRVDPAIRRYAGIYHPADVLAAVEARVPNASAQRLAKASDTAIGGTGLRALAARAYHGRIDAKRMPAEVAAFAAPHAAARACSADSFVPDRRAVLESAARALGVDPRPFGDAALCAELAAIVESQPPT
ncbi:hypothetical protein psal_cds_468 [Pandoravirus salinus]|uniref:Uncharacterized protein n=1 Tax=Pandoravirus salinus TaxID=1349410 RepID=S4VV36_9VIRU|nr:hypothetical protein psal_cds_468 [Pandoravirus salinus]AGO84233.1 hypothetical protein psal_cds_468 [Pandoravirus salinus]